MIKCNYMARFSLCCTIFVLLLSPSNIYAQALGSVITYQGSITSDEDGGKLLFPSFVYAEPVMKEIYVIDGRARITIYTSDLFPLHTLSKKDGIVTPQGLAVDKDGNLYVAQSAAGDNPKHRLSVYNACLKWERDIYFSGFEGAETFVPYRLAIDDQGYFFVTANYFPGALYVDGRGRLIDIISPEENGKKAQIANVSLDKAGNIYLVSEEEGHVYVYDNKRHFLFKFGEKGGSSGKLSRPRGVGVDDRNGRMYVVDYMRHTIAAYDKKGEYIFEFGGLGWGEGWFQHPIDLALDSEGRLIIADMFNQRVQVFNSW